MFKKLLSNLPFNPSLIGQIAFYSQRLRQEQRLRRTGLILLSLALTLQVFAVVSPPQASLARSNNDLITGGFSSQSEALSYCQQNTRNYKTILAYYGITCADLKNATTTSIKSTDNNKRLYSMGHLAYGKQGETPINIPGMSTVYLRYLWAWDHNGPSTYKALEGKTANGLTFYILYDCGNLVFVGLPTPPEHCKYDANLSASDKNCFEHCPLTGKLNLPKTSPQCASTCPYNKQLLSNSSKCFEPCPIKNKENLPKSSMECFTPCQYNSTIGANSSACKPCEASQTSTDLTTCLDFQKSVSNTTRKIVNANNTTALPGDTLRYTLTTTNKGKATIKAYTINENISDVLDYANIIDLGNGTKNIDNIVSWPKVDIRSGQSVSRVITVRIKDPIPSTPVSASDPGHFDLAITNVYGSTVNVKLPASIMKTTEVASQKLPSTGPGTSLLVIFAITALAGYFFARTRLIANELDIVRTDFHAGGDASL